MSRTRKTIESINKYFDIEPVGTVSQLKNHVEKELEQPVNMNTFYNIVHKMKMNGDIECTAERGEYRKGGCETSVEAPKTPVKEERIEYENAKEMPEARFINQEERETITAEEFIRRAVSGLKVKTKYSTLLKNDTSIEPWSITPEYAQCISSIKNIVEEFEKIDAFLEKNS